MFSGVLTFVCTESVGVGGVRMVVERGMFVVSEDGGGGREDMKEGSDERIDARQRKHSPVPK